MNRFLLVMACTLAMLDLSAQRDLPITLSTEVSTTYYTNGTSQSRSRMFFQLAGESPQRMGFLCRRMGRHLSEADAVQSEFKSFQTLAGISQALALATSATLLSAIFSDATDEVTGEEKGWFQVYQWPIYCGVGYLATGYIIPWSSTTASLAAHLSSPEPDHRSRRPHVSSFCMGDIRHRPTSGGHV